MIKSVTTSKYLLDAPNFNEIFDKLVWMNSEEAAYYLRRSPNALRIAVFRGQLRARKWRRRLYFKKIELDLLLETSNKLEA